MRFLELRVPPPLVGLIIAAGMWTAAHALPFSEWPLVFRVSAAVVVAALGAAVALGGVVSFHRARTTVNPLKPESSSALVSSGVYSLTRNPMYLGMALVLLAWAVYLSSVWTMLGPVLFVLYITRFQIIPEERVLDGLFGAHFAEYKKRVRRWI